MNKVILLATVLFLSTAFARAHDECADGSAPVVSTVCVPEPAPQVCAAPAAVQRDPEIYYEVPVTKKVKMQEIYTVNEKRTKTEMEVKKRYTKPNAPRIVRNARGGNARPMKVHKDLPREQTYLKPVKTVYEVPVTKTRDIVVDVEEKTLVPASRMRLR